MIFKLCAQGIFLAILYCFLNSEVQDVIKRHLAIFLIRYDVERGRELTESKFLSQCKPTTPLPLPITTQPPDFQTTVVEGHEDSFGNSVADRAGNVETIPLTGVNSSDEHDGIDVIKVELNHLSQAK